MNGFSRTTMRCCLGVVACVMLLGAGARVQAQPTLVVLVRHAEKAVVPGNDPPLSDLGRERAAALAAALKLSPPTAIIVSALQRTALTADLVAQQTGVKPTVISMDGGTATHIAAVAKAVQASKGVVLVVGHSNTVPAIIKALGGPALPDICDATYAHFFTLTPARDGQPVALTLTHFGASEAPPPASCPGMIPR